MVQDDILPLTSLADAFDEILDASVHLRVVGLLVTLPDKDFTGREIASLLRVSHSNVQRALRALSEDGFVSMRRIGRADVIRVNREHFAFAALRALFLVRRDLPTRVAHDLRDAFRGSARSVVVFGSHARGEAGRTSDLDVLVVADDPAPLERVAAALEAAFSRRYGLPLSVHLLATRELRSARRPAYVREAEKEGVLVLGDPLAKVLRPAG